MTRLVWLALAAIAWVSASRADQPRTFIPNEKSMIVSSGNQEFWSEDGDSFWLGAFRIRLDGVDAVEPGQKCALESGQQCSDAARSFLSDIFANNRVVCTFVLGKDGRPKMNYGRYVSRCSKGGAEDEINRLLLSSGMAFTAEKGADKDYENLVSVAKSNRVGVHAIEDILHPAAFRRGGRASAQLSNVELVAEVGRRWPSLSGNLRGVLKKLLDGHEPSQQD